MPAERPSTLLTIALTLGAVLILAATYFFGRASSDLQTLKTDVAAMRDDLSEMKGQLARAPAGGGGAQPAAAANPVIQIADARIKGKADAPVTLVEFSDYQ